jgi:predicted enzyme related to lactoylglutathione lyase
MKYMALIDVPGLDEGVRFYGQAFGFVESARPMQGYAVIECDGLEIGLLEKAAGTHPAEGSSDVRRYERHWTPVHIDFYVDDFAATLANVANAGGKCEQRFEGGKHAPIAFCSDPFGNGFCVIGKKSAPV